MPHIINCELIATNIKNAISNKITSEEISCKLVILLIGENKASRTYVNKKIEAASTLNITCNLIEFAGDISQELLVEKIEQLNADKDTSGIIVQLPLPTHINPQDVLNAIDPKKDVDGLHFINVGLLHSIKNVTLMPSVDIKDFNANILQQKHNPLIPATALGCHAVLKQEIDIESKKILIFGDSNLVTRPLARMLLLEKATVTTLNSKSKNYKAILDAAEIIILATGKQDTLKMEDVANAKNLQIILDIGTSFDINGKLTGDLSREFYFTTKYPDLKITTVPKGIGPMTVACLMYNVLIASLRQKNTNQAKLAKRAQR